jgi:hypothetical protein
MTTPLTPDEIIRRNLLTLGWVEKQLAAIPARKQLLDREEAELEATRDEVSGRLRMARRELMSGVPDGQ